MIVDRGALPTQYPDPDAEAKVQAYVEVLEYVLRYNGKARTWGDLPWFPMQAYLPTTTYMNTKDAPQMFQDHIDRLARQCVKETTKEGKIIYFENSADWKWGKKRREWPPADTQ